VYVSATATIESSAYVDWYGRARRQNWTTPLDLFARLDDEYRFTIDGASEPGNGLCSRASTVTAPIDWHGERVFCNPPWSNIRPFVDRAPDADLAVLLVPARTNARWFHAAIDLGAVPRFFLGRPRFGGGKSNSPVDVLLLVFGF
jgi:hypothetical protein